MVGNISNYTRLDIFRCFILLEQRRSRNKILSETKLGEGTLRTILGSLKEKGLIESNKKGHAITLKGKKIILKIKEISVLKQIQSKDIFPKKAKQLLLIRELNLKKSIGYRQRDIAIKNGADGALIMLYDKCLKLPGGEDFDCRFIESEIDYNNGDVVIMTFSRERRWAEISAIAVGKAISKKYCNLVNLVTD